MSSKQFVLVAVVAIFGLHLAAAPAAMAADRKVTGIVTMAGKPVASGKVSFYLKDQFVGAKIRDGKYALDHIPVGIHKITFEGNGIPAKYASDETSPLTVEVRDGTNVFNFDLQ